MCGPAIGAIGAVAGTGLQIMGAFQQHAAQKKAVELHNQRVMLNAQQAGIAASNQYADIGRIHEYNARSVQQEGYKSAMESRAGQGTILASAGASGFGSNSLSVQGVYNDAVRQEAINAENVQTKMDGLRDEYISKGRSIEAQARDRINSMSMEAYPSGAALGLNIANAVVGGIGGLSKLAE